MLAETGVRCVGRDGVRCVGRDGGEMCFKRWG